MDFIKNPQTTIALTFLTHIISGIDGVGIHSFNSEVVYRQYNAHYTPAKARGRHTITVRCSVQGRAYL